MNVTVLNDQETDDSIEKIYAELHSECVCVWGGARLTKSETKMVAAYTPSQFITQHLLNVINSSG